LGYRGRAALLVQGAIDRDYPLVMGLILVYGTLRWGISSRSRLSLPISGCGSIEHKNALSWRCWRRWRPPRAAPWLTYVGARHARTGSTWHQRRDSTPRTGSAPSVGRRSVRAQLQAIRVSSARFGSRRGSASSSASPWGGRRDSWRPRRCLDDALPSTSSRAPMCSSSFISRTLFPPAAIDGVFIESGGRWLPWRAIVRGQNAGAGKRESQTSSHRERDREHTADRSCCETSCPSLFFVSMAGTRDRLGHASRSPQSSCSRAYWGKVS